MPTPRSAPTPPPEGARARRPTGARSAPLVALHALGRGALVGAIAVSALLAVELDFGVPRLLVAAVLGFLGFAFVSAGEGLVVLAAALLRGLLGRLRAERAAAAVRAAPAVPVGRVLGAFVYAAGDLLWPQSFLKQVNLPVVGEAAIALTGLAFAAVALARRPGVPRAARVALAAAPVVLVAAFAAWVADRGFDGYLDATTVAAASAPPGLADPGAPGPYAVRTLAYGSGTGTRRPEYGPGVDVVAPTVDGTAVYAGYGGLAGAFHRWYWGFGFDALPLNGLVWLPEADEPRPLVLIVHGNHAMSRPSEPGYAYLGAHLASHGFAVAAIDQNFLNGLFFFDGGFAEMPLRAWLVLRHLQAWRDWSATPGHPLAGRVDLERVALVGHSRGGEAVAWAAHLNAHALSGVSSPDGFGFGIGAVVALAPSDAYAGPNDRKPDLVDADYLLLAGGHDADTFLLYGVGQYHRPRSGADPDRFDALAYLHRANHGQFNAVWGDRDRGLYNSWLLNRAPLLAGDAQRRAAQALVTSFLHASLGGEAGYRAPFENPPTGSPWLPEGVVATQHRSATSMVLADFERGAAAPEGAATARVEALRLRDGVREQGNRALRLEGAAAYEVPVPPGYAARWAAVPAPAVAFALAAVPDAAAPRRVVVELATADGAVARRALGDDGPLVRPLPAHLVKARWLYGRNGFPGAIRPEEVVLQTFTLPLATFAGAAVAPGDVVAVRFAFEGGGAVYLDEVALVGE